MDNIGTISWGVKLPYLREGDDLVGIVLDEVEASYKLLKQEIADCDIIAITESLAARTQGNYVLFADIEADVFSKFGYEEIAVTFPIASRNRVARQLQAIAQAVKKVYLQMSFPDDEVGNPLISQETLYDSKIDYNGVYTVDEFRQLAGKSTVMPLTGVDYLDVYEKLAPNIEIVLANNPQAILAYTKKILIYGVHRRALDRKILQAAGAEIIYDLSEIMNEPSTTHGYNQIFGLYGSNRTGERIKLFPRDCQPLLSEIQKRIKTKYDKHVEVMIYGDGAFKDPQYGVWEFYDPCVSPFYTSGLAGFPNESKLKDLIDSGLSEEEINTQIKNNKYEKGAMGTTPRRYTDLLGSLSDLTSGSGDKATPVVVIKNYFGASKCQEILASENCIITAK